MPDFESSSEIDRQAQELVLRHMAGKAASHVHYARTPQTPAADEPMRIAVAERAAELYQVLVRRAPEMWNDREQLLRLAENATGGTDD